MPLTAKAFFLFFAVKMLCGAPERFAQLLRLLKAAHRIDSDEKWLTSVEAVRSLDFRSISESATDKSRIPQLIEEASVRAIDETLDKLTDQH